MKRAALLYCANIDAARFKVLQQRDQLPLFAVCEDREEDTGWKEYTLEDAFLLRLMLDLIGGEGNELVHSGLPPSYSVKVLSNAMAEWRANFPDHPLLQFSQVDLWLGVVIFEDACGDGEQIRFSRWFANEIGQVSQWIAEREGREGCRAVRASLVNITRAAEFVQRRACDIGVWTDAELAKLKP